MSDARRESLLDGLSIMADETHEALLGNDYRKIEKDADGLLKAAGLPALDHEGADVGRLCRRLLLAKQEYIDIERERWDGIHRKPIPMAVPSTAKPALPSVPPSKPFSEVAKLYFSEIPKAERTSG